MFKIIILLALFGAMHAQSPLPEMRTVNIRETINGAVSLLIRMRGTSVATEITKIVSELQSLTPSEIAMLNNKNRREDNELVDLANKINNLVVMISSDISDPSGVGALIMAGNDLKVYLQKHRSGGRIANEKSLP